MNIGEKLARAKWRNHRPIDRFLDFVSFEPNTGCWLWIGAGSSSGDYGRFWDGDRSVQAHRFSYEYFIGPIPDELELDHLCRVHCCVNPAHLEPVTYLVNIERGIMRERRRQASAAIASCLRGHPLSGENVYMNSGRRHCRECRRACKRTLRTLRRSA